MKKNLRLILEIAGGVVAAVAVIVAAAQFSYQRHHDAREAYLTESDKEHAAILGVITAETEARKTSDGQLADAIKTQQESIAELTRAVQENASTTRMMIAELKIVMTKMGLDGQP